MKPAYRARLTPRELKEKAERLMELQRECEICPRECRARRSQGRYGVCRSTDRAVISSATPHYGEEPPLVGFNGSGTIFFTSCQLKCLFCQNYEISQLRIGRPVSIEALAEKMLSLERLGCHNINLVTPTHFVPQIVAALVLAAEGGLSVPLVYNCGGYESVRTLNLLDGIVDIYMPDIKYSDNDIARRSSGAGDYWDIVRPAVAEMQRQVGCLTVDDSGIAVRGLLIRHLVLPGAMAGSKAVLDFIAREISTGSYVNIMDQYRPAYRAHQHPDFNRRLRQREFSDVIDYAHGLGLTRGF